MVGGAKFDKSRADESIYDQNAEPPKTTDVEKAVRR